MGDSGAMISSNGTNATASLACPNCNLNLAGFPAGLRFAPTDQQLIEHLESMVLVKEGEGSRVHALLNHFIPTIEGGNDICYTHPENLPGVTRDGHSRHFFHRTSKAYPTGTRKRRKILSESGQRSSSEYVGDAHWHKTGKTHPVVVGGRQKGCKKILVLHNIKQGMRERTNWVMHQYHLGMNEEENDGELVLSKVFYRCPDVIMADQNDEKTDVASEGTSNILPAVSGAAAVTAASVTMVQQQQHQLLWQAHGHGQHQCKFAPPNVFQEAGVGDLVSGDQGQVHGNNQHIPPQHLVLQSVRMEPDTTLSLQVAVGDPVSGDQGQVHGNNHHIQSQNHVQSVDTEPNTTLSLSLSTGWCSK